MIRIVVQNLLLFLLPTLLYAGYVSLARRRAQAAGVAKPSWEEGPWFWLLLSGGALVVVSLLVLTALGEYNPEGVYRPATVEDGKIVPGGVK